MTSKPFSENCVNEAGTELGEGVAHGRDFVGCRQSQTVIKLLHQPKDNMTKFRFCTLNVGSLRGRSGEVAEFLERRDIDLCCVQETRWRGKSVRIVEGKQARYKIFWIGNSKGTGGVGIFLAEKWVEKVIDIKRVSDRIMIMKLMIGKTIVSALCTYAPQSGLSEELKDEFYDSLIDVTSKLGEKEVVLLGGDLNGHVGEKSDGFEGVHGGNGFGERNREGERILEFCCAMDMIVANTTFHKRESHLVTYESGLAKTQVDYVLVNRKSRKFVLDVKVIPGEEVVTQHKPVICNLQVTKPREIKRKFAPKRKVWKLNESEVRTSFKEQVEMLISEQSHSGESESVDEIWLQLKDTLLAATEKVCGWTKGPPRHQVTWWWNDDVENCVKEKRRVWKEWKKGLVPKETYLEVKRIARRAIYQAKLDAEKERFPNATGRDDHKNEIFKIAKQMKKTNQDIVGEKCIRKDDGDLAITEKDKKDAWKSYYENLLNTEFEWSTENLEQVESVAGPAIRIEKEMVKEAVAKMKKGKAAGPSGIVAEMLQAAGDKGIEIVTNLANRIVQEGVIPKEWESSTIVNCYKGKGEAVERGNYRGLKLMDQVLKVVERVIEKLIRAEISIDDMQFGFMPGRGTTDAIFILRQLQEKYLGKKKKIFFAFVDLEKAFDRVPRQVVWWSLRKLGVSEWLVKVVQAMYTNAKSRVRINKSFSDSFDVKVGVHQGSVLSPLLFICVLEALSRGFRTGCPEEMLYADDLVLASESMEGLKEKMKIWREGIESKGLRVNMTKTKIMMCDTNSGKQLEKGKYPCSVCAKGVGRNSIVCAKCKHWVHKRCSGIKGKLTENRDYTCKACIEGNNIPEPHIDKVNLDGAEVEVVDSFCYLGDRISNQGGAEGSATARIKCGWLKFRELLPLLTSRSIPFSTKGRLYQACVRLAMLHGSETWPVRAEELQCMERNDMRMIRWMCNVSLKDRVSSEELRRRLRLESISTCLQNRRLSWFGHVERSPETSWINKCRQIHVPGEVGRGRPKKTWGEVIKTDLKQKGVTKDLAQDRLGWKSISKARPTHASM